MGWPKGKKRGPRPMAPVPTPKKSPVEAPVAPTVQSKPAPVGAIPTFGFHTLVNRTTEPYTFFYEETPHTVYTEYTCPTAMAKHAMRRSIISWNPISGVQVYALGIRGESDCTPVDPKYLNQKELIDRSDMPVETDPTTGQPLHAKIVTVPGGGVYEDRNVVSPGALDFQQYPEG